MKKKIIIAVSVIAAVVLFLILGGVLSGDSSNEKTSPKNAKIYIGVFESTSGINASGGEQETLGLQYAQSLRPTVTVDGVTYDIVFVTADNASETNAAKTAAEYLVSSNVSAVLGSYGSSVSQVGGAVFLNSGIPAIAISCGNPAVIDNSLYFGITYNDSFQGSVLANFSYGKGYRNIAVITQVGDIYSKSLGEYFSAEFIRLGGRVETLTFNSGQKNFDSLKNQLSTSGYDAVFMPSSCSSGAIFINQARTAGYQKPIIGSDTWDDQTLFSKATASLGEIYLPSAFNPEGSADSVSASFAAKFSSWVELSSDRLEKNGGSSYVPPVTALAYDAYMMLCDAIEKADSFVPENIADQLKITNHTGVTGECNPGDPSGNSKKTVYIKSVKSVEEDDAFSYSFELVQTYLGK